jgi:hypothetical protein
MVRSILVPKKKTFSIEVPESFIGKKVEVIAFTIEDLEPEVQLSAYNDSKKFQAVGINTNGFKFDREEANER